LSAGAYLEGLPIGFNIVVLMQRQPMLWARSWLRRSRPCWRTRCPCLRSRRRRVAVAPSWSRCFDHRCRRGPRVALLLRRHGHAACVTVAPMLLRSCRSDTAAVAVTSRTSRSRRCYGVAVAPTIATAADALSSRCRCVAVTLPLRRHALAGVVRRPQRLGWGRSPGTDAHGFVGALVSLLAVASPSRRHCHIANALSWAIAARTRLAPFHVALLALSVALGFEAS
jgi:hypothetical protein